MKIIKTDLPGVLVVEPQRFNDARGYFQESYNNKQFREAGIDVNFVQDNVSLSRQKFTVRGLHFQTAPHAQAKLVGCPCGRLLDVAVDLRPSSPTFRKHFSIELSSDDGKMLFIPAGFGHGFCNLVPDTLIAYKVSVYYAPAHDHGVNWLDDELAIDWPVDSSNAILSEKDRKLPALSKAILEF